MSPNAGDRWSLELQEVFCTARDSKAAHTQLLALERTATYVPRRAIGFHARYSSRPLARVAATEYVMNGAVPRVATPRHGDDARSGCRSRCGRGSDACRSSRLPRPGMVTGPAQGRRHVRCISRGSRSTYCRRASVRYVVAARSPMRGHLAFGRLRRSTVTAPCPVGAVVATARAAGFQQR
jgi:hypothetical protein